MAADFDLDGFETPPFLVPLGTQAPALIAVGAGGIHKHVDRSELMSVKVTLTLEPRAFTARHVFRLPEVLIGVFPEISYMPKV